MTRGLPSTGVPDHEKRGYSEAEVHARLFEADMHDLGYPARTNTQADGEHFAEQGALAVRRLKTARSQGRFDGLYMIGNSPIVLCEIKRYEALDSPGALQTAVRQLEGYARSEDFATPPPFLILYCGKPERTRFYRRRVMADGSLLDGLEYEELGEVWEWARIKDAHLRGSFAEEEVDRPRLLAILRYHLDRIEDDIRQQVRQAVEIASSEEPPGLLAAFGRELVANPSALNRMRLLYERKVAEIGRGGTRRVIEEMVTQASLNYLNKAFFLSLCEDRNLPGFYRIMREFLPSTRTETRPTTAAVFLALLRRKMRDSVGPWGSEEEAAYRDLRQELTPEIREHVIEQNNWWKLIRVAFDLAGERFPLVYREDAYDFFRPHPERLAELVYDLSTKSFHGLSNRSVGDLYQGLLSSRRGRSGRRQQATLGAFYTPQGDVDYMVSQLRLRRGSRVLDPCMGSGHFLEGLLERLTQRYVDDGFTSAEAYREIVGGQLFGADIDTFATSLAAIRLFLLDETGVEGAPNLFVHDMLLHTPERPGRELFSNEMLQAEGEVTAARRAVSVDQEVDDIASIDETRFDAVVGNPPYGARKPKYKERAYGELYGSSDTERRAGSSGTGDRDSYAMFITNGIERLREGGRLCFITSDTFRSLATYAALRRHILDRCKIVEILLTDTHHFEGVSFQFAGMAITTLEKCADADARALNPMRLVDTIRDPVRFGSPPAEKVSLVQQSEYEALPDSPFWVGVPREVLDAARSSGILRDVARGRQGLASADDRRFLAGVGEPAEGLTQRIDSEDLAGDLSEEERRRGISASKPHWVPFSKGSGTGEYSRPPRVAIDWSEESVAELERRAAFGAGTPRKAYLRNRDYYFEPGLTYSVVSTGRVSARLLPEGWIIGHKGSGVFVEDSGTSQLFLLGYLNSSLATYFMRKIVNTTATADVGYLEKLPYRRPGDGIEQEVLDRVERIIAAREADSEVDIETLRDEIDDRIFDLFGIQASREEVRGLYRRAAEEEGGGQAADE